MTDGHQEQPSDGHNFQKYAPPKLVVRDAYYLSKWRQIAPYRPGWRSGCVFKCEMEEKTLETGKADEVFLAQEFFVARTFLH